MLFKLVDQTCRKLEQLDVDRDWIAMLGELETARPDFVDATRGMPVIGERMLETTAKELVAIAKQSADMARQIATDLRNDKRDLGIQVGRATILAYFVQPNDIVPDSAPGGYGFLDDVLLLRVGASEALAEMFPADSQRRIVWLLCNALPEEAIATLGEIMTQLQQAIQTIAATNPIGLGSILTQLVANPLAGPMPPAQGFAPRARRFSLQGPDGLRVPGTVLAGGALMVGDKVISMDPSHKPGSFSS